ncbi:MAG: DUF5666 domain-containing protein [candidate division KSB1 bacterium]|nr:DUF5666 domain-containing protein [candidate division KSB1 bacterium]
MPKIVVAQALMISSSADFSTFTTHFTFEQTLYIRIQPSQIDFTNITENSYSLEPEANGSSYELEGSLVNHWDGTFTASISLSELPRTFSQWMLEVKLEDRRQNHFKESLLITIVEGSSVQPVGDIIIEGTLQTIASNSILVSGQSIFVNQYTEVYKDGSLYSLDDIEVKLQSIKVYGQSQTDGTILARRIDILDEGSVSIEYEGRIAVIAESRFFMSGVWILVDADTEIKGRDGREMAFSQLKVGYKVKCEVVTLDKGTALASEIKVMDTRTDNYKIDVFGEVTQVLSDGRSPDTLKVDHEYYEVHSKTDIIGFHGEKLAITDLIPGEDLQLKAKTRNNKIPLIEKIYRVVNRNLPMTARGKITAVGDGSLNISGLALVTDDLTIILDTSKQFIEPSRLKEGVRVEVLAEPKDGQLYANTVLLLSESLGAVLITDVIQHIEQDRIRVGDFTFFIDSSTQFYDAIGQPVDREFFENGDLVEVRGMHLNDDKYLAQEIWQRSLKQDEVSLRGTIALMQSDRLEIENTVFVLNSDTRYFLADGSETGDLGQFFPGRIVEVLARVSGGQKFARSVSLVDKLDEELVLTGPIDAIGPNWLKVANENIQLSSVSELKDETGASMGLNALRPGDRVEARTKILPAGGLFGWQIRRLAQPHDSIHAEGPVDQIQGGQVRVNNLSFLIDAQTAVTDAQGNAIQLDAIQRGWLIRVEAKRIGNLYLAARIRVLSRIQYTGTIETISAAQTTITQTTFSLPQNVLVLNSQGAPVSVDSLRPGDQVQSVADLSGDAPTLRRIRILSKRNVTGIEDVDPPATVPRTFQVLPSYPNPITRGRIAREGNTLRLVLSQAERVSISVYNLLGQKIRDLVANRLLSAGEHRVRWDGRTASGVSVAAGVYFYQITNGTNRFIRKVLILP